MPRSTASIRYGRSVARRRRSRLTEPISTARSTMWIESNSRRQLAHLLARAPRSRASARSARSRRRSAPSAASIRSSSVDDPRVARACAASTSRAKTTAAAGEPPITDACAPSTRDRLELVVQPLREDHERAAVVARDDAEHDRAAEVDDRAADLGAVLELPAGASTRASRRSRRGWPATTTGAAAAGGVDRARDLLRRAAGTACPRSTARGRRRAAARSAAAGATRCRSRSTGQPPRWASQTTAASASRIAGPALERRVVGVDHRAHHASGCRTAACGRGWSRRRRSSPTRRELRARRAVRRVARRRGRSGRRSRRGAGSARPGAT